MNGQIEQERQSPWRFRNMANDELMQAMGEFQESIEEAKEQAKSWGAIKKNATDDLALAFEEYRVRIASGKIKLADLNSES